MKEAAIQLMRHSLIDQPTWWVMLVIFGQSYFALKLIWDAWEFLNQVILYLLRKYRPGTHIISSTGIPTGTMLPVLPLDVYNINYEIEYVLLANQRIFVDNNKEKYFRGDSFRFSSTDGTPYLVCFRHCRIRWGDWS